MADRRQGVVKVIVEVLRESAEDGIGCSVTRRRFGQRQPGMGLVSVEKQCYNIL